jgi:hypothetical protein
MLDPGCMLFFDISITMFLEALWLRRIMNASFSAIEILTTVKPPAHNSVSLEFVVRQVPSSTLPIPLRFRYMVLKRVAAQIHNPLQTLSDISSKV